MCMAPLSGPSHRNWLSPVKRRENAPRSDSASATGMPATSGTSARTAATCTSLPRPTVNASPYPSSPALVRMITYAAE